MVTELTVTLAEAELLTRLVSVGMELVRLAVFSQFPALVAWTVIVRIETLPGAPGAKLHWPFTGL